MSKNNSGCGCGHDHNHSEHNHSTGCGCSSHTHTHEFIDGICQCGAKEIERGSSEKVEACGCGCGHDHSHENASKLHSEDSDEEEPSECNCGEHHSHKEIKPLVGILNLSPKTIESNSGEKIKTEIMVKGLHCGSCAAKIEKIVNELDEVESATMNFATSTLIIFTTKNQKKVATEKSIKLIMDTEPGTTAEIKGDSSTKEIEYILQGLNCAACSAKIESRVNNLKEVKSASYNFATTTLSVEVFREYETIIGEKVEKIVVDLEPHVKVIAKNNQQALRNSDKDKGKEKKRILKFGIGIAALAIALPFKDNSLSVIPFLISYLVIGGDIVYRSYKNIKRGQIFDENFLMTIATFAAIGVGEYFEAIMVMLLYQIGEYFQGRAVESSRESIANLMDIRPDYANLKTGDSIKKVSPEEIKIGDLIVVKPGEKVPLDGIIVEGSASVDTKALTGESVPQDLEKGEKITSGFINIDGVLTIKLTNTFKDSAVSKILDLVQNASAKKAKTELRITKFAKYYTPAVVFIAVAFAMIPPIALGGDWAMWIERAATFLVVSCPCALVISVPMTYFAGIGSSSKRGILVKGGNYLEALSDAKIVVFDKTGTLTEGNFKVSDVYTTGEYKAEDVLKYTAYVESFSNHPIATSIVREFGQSIDKNIVKEYKEIRGKGVKALVDGLTISCGNVKFLRDQEIEIEDVKSAGTIVYTAINGKYAGHIVIKDQVKKDSKKAVKGFNELGINKVVMLTGDRRLTAESAANEIGIRDYYYELLPQDKVSKVEELINKKNPKESLIFVGDGINDAPVLARADIGIAMGGVGSDAAIEAADVVIMNDEPSKIINAIRIAKKTKRIANQNIAISLGVKAVILLLAAGGHANMMMAVFGDVGVSLIAVFNAMRALKE